MLRKWFAGRAEGIGLILVVAALLRLVGLDWGNGHPIHPDERHVMNMVSGMNVSAGWQQADLNPHNFAYGSLPLYMLRATAYGLGQMGYPWAETYSGYFLIGRTISTIAAVLTVWLVFILGRRMFDRTVGWLAAVFLTLSVLHIELSHFYTVEQVLILMITLSFWASFHLARRGGFLWYLLAGIFTGMAVATKFSALPLGAVLVTAHLLNLNRQGKLVSWDWLWLLLCFLAAYATFFVCEPYGFNVFPLPWDYIKSAPISACLTPEYWSGFLRALFAPQFMADFMEQSNMARGISQPIYVAVYENTKAYVYQAKELLAWGMGPPLGLLCLAGMGVMAYQVIQRLLDGLVNRNASDTPDVQPQKAGQFELFIGSALLMAWLLPNSWIIGGFKVKYLRYLAPLLPFLCLTGAKLALDLFRSKERVVALAARWGLCATLLYSAFYCAAYSAIFFRPHTHVQASEWFAKNGQPDSKILQEHWDETLPYSLPQTPRFTTFSFPSYEPDSESKAGILAKLLENGDYLFCTSDRIYGTILSWKERWPQTSRMYKLLFRGDLGYDLVGKFASPPSLMGITLDDWNADESFINYDHPTVLVFQNKRRLPAEDLAHKITTAEPSLDALDLTGAIGLLPALDSAWTDREPNIGQALRWWVALIALGWIAFPFCFHAFKSFPDRGLGLSKTVGPLLLSYLVWLFSMVGWTGVTRGSIWLVMGALTLASFWVWSRSRAEISEFLRSNRRLVIGWELAFLVVGGIFLVIRAYNPEIYWGEKPMDFSFLNAFMRMEKFPPVEPWFSGALLNYYYFGFVIVSTLGKLAAVSPGILYNLALAMIPAQVFVTALTLSRLFTRRSGLNLLTACMVVFLGNLSAFWMLFVQTGGRHWQWGFDLYWATSRVIQSSAIEEYPLWTFLFSDLHAHMMAMPQGLLALACILGLLWGDAPGGRIRFALCGVGLVAMGSLFVTNTWDFISYSAVAGAVAFSWAVVKNETSDWRDWPALLLHGLLKGGIAAGLFAAGGLLLYFPYFDHFNPGSTYRGFNTPSRGGEFVPLGPTLLLFGQFLWIHWSALFLFHSQRRLGMWIATWLWAAALVVAFKMGLDQRPFITAEFYGALSLLALITGVWSEPERRFVPGWLLLSMGAAIVGGTELYTLADRANTIFKFYNTAWYLLALSAGFCIYRTLKLIRTTLDEQEGTRLEGAFLFVALPWLALTGGILGVALFSLPVDIHGVTSVERVPSERPTLDGSAYLPKKFPDDSAGIDWLNRNVHGMATLLEAWGPSYQDFTRVCMHTGLQTVLGWDYHVQQRGQEQVEIQRRKQDIQLMYKSDNPLEVAELLDRYAVDYVFVGQMEANSYGNQVLERFDRVSNLELVFSQGKARIYRRLTGGAVRVVAGAKPVKGLSVFLAPELPGLAQVGGLGLAPEDLAYVLDWRQGTLLGLGRSGEVVQDLGKLLEASLPEAGRQRIQSIAVGLDGRVLAVDPWNSQVFEIQRSGSGLTTLSTGLGLRSPQGAAFDNEGRVWIADTGNNRLMRLDQPPLFVTDAEDGPLLEPTDIVPRPLGGMLVFCMANRAVYEVSAEGRAHKLFELPPAPRSALDPWISLAGTIDGQVYVSDPGSGLLYSYDVDLGLVALQNAPRTPTGLALDPSENLLVGDGIEGGVYLMPKSSGLSAFDGGQGAAPGQMQQPRGVAMNADGSFWVADFDNHRIQRFRPSGAFLLATGSQGAGDAEFNQPCDVAALPDGGVAVADTWNHRVQILDAKGRFVRAFNSQLYGPRGIATGPDGNVYVTDTGNAMIKVFDPTSGSLVRQWGGHGSEAGRMELPVGIALSQDQVFVADVKNKRLQVFTLTGDFVKQFPVPGWSEGQEPHLAWTESGRLLMTQPASNSIVIVNLETGQLEPLQGAPAGLQSPTGLDIRGGILLISDTGNHRLRKLQLSGLNVR